MVSPEMIRRYPFFAGLDSEHIVALARLGEEKRIEAGKHFFEENTTLASFYLLLEGAVAIVIGVPDRSVTQDVSGQLMGDLVMKDITVSTVGSGSVFGWPALLPPHHTTAGAKALMPCKVVQFDAQALWKHFEEDSRFGFLMTQKAAAVLADRLRDIRIETLAQLVE